MPALPLLLVHPEIVSVDIVGCQEVADTEESTVGGSVSDRFPLRCPRSPGLRLDLDWSELVETDYGRSFRGLLVE